MASDDRSEGWDAVAEAFIASRSSIGLATVEAWARDLPVGGAVLDAGCGFGAPVGQALLRAGLQVFGVDASPKLVAAFRQRFPEVEVACEPVQDSSFFDRRFDGVAAIGLVFLLSPEDQEAVIGRFARALKDDGRLLFTAPEAACAWQDVSTGRRSASLGLEAYRRILAENGMALQATSVDEGGNHYVHAVRRREAQGDTQLS